MMHRNKSALIQAFDDLCVSRDYPHVGLSPKADTQFVEANFVAVTAIFDKAVVVHSLPRSLICAYGEPRISLFCTEKGTFTCSACKLVKYCSKQCQREHWLEHKKVCKHSIRLLQWQPAWVAERRQPLFISAPDFKTECHLWGNVPAYDLLNISSNKESCDHDLSICFPASGDLRNIILTVNNLPFDYNHDLTILLNDGEPNIVIRNIMLLLILGSTLNPMDAANVALHFWYSVYLPEEYFTFIVFRMGDFSAHAMNHKEESYSTKIGSRAVLSGEMSKRFFHLMTQMPLNASYGVQGVKREMNRVRFGPVQNDRYDSRYERLGPSYRLASHEYRKFGLVLPFAARRDRFNTPNHSLFSPEGKWLQDDLADPLQSWDTADVFAAGRHYGVPQADVYGCLYFYLRDQLSSFAERLKTFNISFHLFNLGPSELATRISTGYLYKCGISRSILFDRIDLSNIVECECVGISKALTDWEPYLAACKDATLLAHFRSWFSKQKGGHLSSVGEDTCSEILSNMLRDNRVRFRLINSAPNGDLETLNGLVCNNPCMMTYYDNAKAFQTYLNTSGLPESLRQLGLKRKTRHTIVPPCAFNLI
ncbi:hypothetical protein BXZ70DRAFT_987516 [Cristinia sonorae]|uniref:MYND-type domain-containing protein n=1 Tax=Cristinia sonorae TaxID=1940300 RepID=A0A8K0UQA7_9AGAR|nr:hypothetical protein BXZ70DRAFT_987516 [Cristinia sonorae]